MKFILLSLGEYSPKTAVDLTSPGTSHVEPLPNNLRRQPKRCDAPLKGLRSTPDIIQLDGDWMVIGCLAMCRNCDPSRGYRENYDKSRLHRPGPYRSDGTGGVLLEPHGFHPYRSSQPSRTACRGVKQSTARKSLELGLRHYTRDDLETVRAAGETLHIHVLGPPGLPWMLRPSLLAQRLLRSTYWERSTPARPSRPL